MYRKEPSKEQITLKYEIWNENMAKKLSSMYRKYKRLLGKYQAYTQGDKDPLEPKWSDNLIEEVIKYKGENRNIKKFFYFDYGELTVENLHFVKFFEDFGGKNPICPEQTGQPTTEHNSIEMINQEQNLVFKKFHEISCIDRLKIVYFFCLIRALSKDKDGNVALATPQNPPNGNNTQVSNNKISKRLDPLGVDKNGDEYYFFDEHKDGRIYKLEQKSARASKPNKDFAECFSSVESLKRFIGTIKNSENKCEQDLLRAIEVKLPILEENEKETENKEQIRIRKLQSLHRSKKLMENTHKQYADAYNTEVPLVNLISNTVMTRAQLHNLKNRLTKPLTTEDILREKYERQKRERQKRLEKRQKVSKKLIY